jgi:acyl carrier protein
MNTADPRKATPQQIHEVLWKITADRLSKAPAQLRPESRLVHDLGADSLDLAEIAMGLEEELALTVPTTLFEKTELTLADVERSLVEAR